MLIVGAGNSGADIAMEVVQGHTTLLSGRDVGHIPFPINRFTAGTGYPVVRFAFHRVLKANTRPARKIKRELAEGHGLPLVRVKPKHLTRAGVQRVPRTVGVQDGLPLLEDGRVLDVANVIWCTGFRPDFSWIDLAHLRRRRRAGAHPRGRGDRARPVLRRPGLPVRRVVGADQRRRPRRTPRGERHRLPGPPRASSDNDGDDLRRRRHMRASPSISSSSIEVQAGIRTRAGRHLGRAAASSRSAPGVGSISWRRATGRHSCCSTARRPPQGSSCRC